MSNRQTMSNRFSARRTLLALPLAGFLALAQADAAPAVHYKDGEYTSDTVTIEWGPVQIKVVIDGGKITDVQFLQVPFDRTRSVEISDLAKPILKSEAIEAQAAQVNLVSSATMTSVAFRQAMASALAKAK
jgi:uncharacterized protein with FMN-binding domain